MLLPKTKGRRWIEEGERGDALPCGRGAVTMGRRHGSDLSGLRPGKRKKASARSSLPRPRTHRLSRCLAMNGGGESEGRQWRGGGKRTGGGIDGRAPWFIGRRCRFGNRPWAVKARAGARRSRPKRQQRRMTPAGRGKGKRKGERELAPCLFGEKEEGAGATQQREEELCLRPLEASAWSGGGRVVTTAMTAGRFGAERRHERQARAGADGGGDWPVGHHGARAGSNGRRGDLGDVGRKQQRGRGGARLGAAHEHACAAYGQCGGEGEREREREPGREGEMGREGFGPSNPREAK
ncbi:Epstein-Barr virus EBNA-1-like protein [Oryza sativa Japonica Group]|uniref:Epstein-Barr virus EBNA-1-like protein n=1 Tax=Oryza sativa subsp. japonica TaxID=39947 RepID=Q5N7T9_ORYSJ|nr:Epstein-Barr virus EBNA-1-like protein [Oryza sativa Japonica Group]